MNLLILLWEKRFKNKQRNIKKIEDQGKKEVEALKDLKPKEQTKAIEDKSDNENNQSIAANIFNNRNKRRKWKLKIKYLMLLA